MSKDRISQRKQPQQARSEVTVNSILEALTQILERDLEQQDSLSTVRVAERAGVSGICGPRRGGLRENRGRRECLRAGR